MRAYDAATAAHIAARAGLVARRLVHIKARNRQTDLVESLGLWTGEYDLAISLEGESRSYVATGGLLASDPITAGPGLDVRVYRLQLSALPAEIEGLVKGYDTRFAPVDMHRALFDPQTRALIGAPHRIFRGMINEISFPRAEAGGTALAQLDVVSETRILTRTLPLKKSDESHQARGGDRFRRYGDISGSVPVYWGEKRIDPPGDSKAKPPSNSGSTSGDSNFLDGRR